MKLAVCVIAAYGCVPVFGQDAPDGRIRPEVISIPSVEGRVDVVYLRPRYSTAIRMQDAVNSVVLGDPTAFTAEHSEQEPRFVFVKPIVETPAQSNLHVTTKSGKQTTLLLVSRGESQSNDRAGIHFGVQYRLAGPFVIPPAEYPTRLVSETAPLSTAVPRTGAAEIDPNSNKSGLDALLDRQRAAVLPKLFGGKPDVSTPGGDLVKCGASEVLDSGREVAVLFSVVNPQQRSIEIMPPQIQLGG